MVSVNPRRLASATAAALATLMLATSGVSAAPRPITFDVFIGDYCVFGSARSNSFLKVVIHDKSGGLKGRGAVEADSDGNWEACLDAASGAILPGDKINARVFDTSQSRTFKVPVLTAKVDRGNNVISGKAPAGSSVSLEAFDFRFDLWGETYDVNHTVTAANGTYSYDFDADGVNIRGGARTVVRWRSGGDTVQVGRFQIAPYVSMQIGRSDVAGASGPNRPIRVSLASGSGGAAVAEANGVGAYGDTTFYGTFADDDGEPYKLVGGEQLSAPALGSFSSWTVPQINPTADLTSDSVSGTCFANGRVMALAQNPKGFEYGVDKGTAASDGHFTIDLSAQLDIKKGYRLAVLCYSPEGDEVVKEATAR